MSRANDCAVPVAHHDIVSILETVRAGAVADALLAFLELLKQAEISGHCPAQSASASAKSRAECRPLAMTKGEKKESCVAERAERA